MSTEVKKKKKTGSYDNNKFIAILAVSLAVIVVLVSVLSIVVFTTGNHVAKLNDQKLYNYEYIYYLNQQLSKLSGDIEIPEDATDEEAVAIYKEFFTAKDENGKYALEKYRDNALEELKIFKTSYQLAVKKGYTLTEQESENAESYVDYMIDYYSQIYSQYDSSITYEDLVSYICGNMTVDQYKEYSKQEATIAKYKEAMKKEYNITDEELKKVYDENVSDYRTATVQKFFLSTMTTNEKGESVAMADADKAAVKAKIDDYLAKFKSGDMVFEDTIKAASEETNAATSLGKSTINNNSLSGDTKVDEWALAKTAADAEGAYEVIESEKGYYIIRCNEVEDFDNSVDSEDGKKISIKNQIKQKIETERSDEQMRKEAEEAKGYELSDIKTDRIQDFLSENETVATLVSQYGAKIGD